MLRILSSLFVLVISLTACPIPVIRPYQANLTLTPEAIDSQPASTSAGLTGQIDGTTFVVNGNYSNFVNDPAAAQSTGLVTSVVVSAPSVSSLTCNLTFTTQIVKPSALSYTYFAGQVYGNCDVSGSTNIWLDALNQSKLEVVIKTANFPNGVVKGVFIPQ